MKFRSSLLRHSVITLLLVLLFLTACGAPTPDVGRDNPQDQPVTAGMAPVESIEILILVLQRDFGTDVRFLVPLDSKLAANGVSGHLETLSKSVQTGLN